VLECAVVLTLEIVCIVVLPVLLLVFYVVQRSNPRRFKLTATLLKVVSIDVEIDAQGQPDKLPPGAAETQLPSGNEPPSPEPPRLRPDEADA
jgi:hypothetical protein